MSIKCTTKRKVACWAFGILVVLTGVIFLWIAHVVGRSVICGFSTHDYWLPSYIHYNYTMLESPINLQNNNQELSTFADSEATFLNDGIVHQLDSVVAWPERRTNANGGHTHHIILHLFEDEARDYLSEVKVHGLFNDEWNLHTPRSLRVQLIAADGLVLSDVSQDLSNNTSRDDGEEGGEHWVEFLTFPELINTTTTTPGDDQEHTSIISQVWLDVVCDAPGTPAEDNNSKCGITEVALFAYYYYDCQKTKNEKFNMDHQRERIAIIIDI